MTEYDSSMSIEPGPLDEKAKDLLKNAKKIPDPAITALQLGAPLEAPLTAPAQQVPLAMVVQKIPFELRDEPQLVPLPPFAGCVLVGEFHTDADAVNALNPEVVPMCVFVSQVADDSFGRPVELRWFVYRMHAVT